MNRVPAVLERFPEIWLIDFEFISTTGERPDPVCAVAHELRSGRVLRVWEDELRTPSGLKFDQLIFEKGRCVHISFDPRLRGQVKRQPGGPNTKTFPGLEG